MRSGLVSGVFFNLDHPSWAGSEVNSLRSVSHPLGLPCLSGETLNQVLAGNREMKASLQLLREAISCGLPCLLLYDGKSVVEHTPNLLRALAQGGNTVTLDQCQFGGRFRKLSRVAGWHVGPIYSLALRCKGQHGVCSLSGKRHLLPRSWSKSSVPTARCSIPTKLCSTFAALLARAKDSLELHRLTSLVAPSTTL